MTKASFLRGFLSILIIKIVIHESIAETEGCNNLLRELTSYIVAITINADIQILCGRENMTSYRKIKIRKEDL